jgi:hypothetical protein
LVLVEPGFGGGPMMPAPTKGQPVEPTTSAISSMLRGLTALHST